MPRIPIFTAEGNVARYNPPLQDPGAMAAPGRALAQLGGAAADLGTDFLQKYAEARQQADAAQRVATASRALSDSEEIRRKDIDSVRAYNGFNDDAAKIRADALKDVTDLRVSNYVGSRIDTETMTRGDAVRRESFGNEASAARGRIDAQTAQYKHQAATGATPEIRALAHDNAMAAIKGGAAAGYVTGENAQARVQDFNQDVAVGKVRYQMSEALTTQDLELAALKMEFLAKDMQLNPDRYADIPPEQFGTLAEEVGRAAYTMRERYENSLKEDDAIARRHTVEAAQDNIDSLRITGVPIAEAPTDEQIKKAFPKDPVQADKVIALTDMAAKFHDAKVASTWTSASEDGATAASHAPEPGSRLAKEQEAEYTAFVAAQNAKYKQLREDPAAYIWGNSPDTAKAFASAQTPEQMKAAIAMQDGLYDRLEWAAENRAVLPKETAQGAVAKILADPANAPASYENLSRLYGDAWPRVFADLTTLGKLPPAMQAVGNLMDQGRPTRDATMLARWVAESKGRDAAELIGATSKSDIDKVVIGDPGVQALQRSLWLQGLPNSQIAAITDGITMLGYAKRFQDQDQSAGQHATAAFLDKYEFLGGARIPRENYSAVSSAATLTLNALKPEQVQIPAGYSGAEGKGGPLGTPEQFVELLQDSSLWVNNPRADGLRLMDIDGKYVRTKDGTILEIPFSVTPPAVGPPNYAPVTAPQGP